MRNMDLDEVVRVIKAENSLRKSKHQRKMALLKARRTGSHGDLLMLLERMMAVAEWETMSAEEMLTHLFSEQSDPTMSKAVMEVLATPTPTVALTLFIQVHFLL